jgi:hypothetical protein
MSNRSYADYHGYRLWVEARGPFGWRIWIVGPAAKGAGGQVPPGKTIMTETAPQSHYPSERAAQDYAADWVRKNFLSYLNPVDEPDWHGE